MIIIYTLFLYIEKNNDDDENLIKAILILIDMHLRCHNCKSLVQSILPILEQIIKKEEYKLMMSAVLANNIDLFFNNFDIKLLDLLKNILTNPKVDNQIFNEWIIKKISQSSHLSEIQIDKTLLRELLTDD